MTRRVTVLSRGQWEVERLDDASDPPSFSAWALDRRTEWGVFSRYEVATRDLAKLVPGARFVVREYYLDTHGTRRHCVRLRFAWPPPPPPPPAA